MEVAIPKPIYFDRFLGGKIAAYFIENTRCSYGYVCQPTRKRYFSVPHRSYVGPIDPVKKWTGLYSSSSSSTIFPNPSNPGTRTQAGTAGKLGPYGPDKPKCPGGIWRGGAEGGIED